MAYSDESRESTHIDGPASQTKPTQSGIKAPCTALGAHMATSGDKGVERGEAKVSAEPRV